MGSAASSMILQRGAPIFAALILTGCFSSTEQTVSGGDSASERMRRFENRFVPSAEDQPAARAEGNQTTGDPKVAPETASAPPQPAAPEEVAGFRIQLFSTDNFDEAGAKKGEAETLFPGEWVYLQYDQPTYKIRVGNFLARFDAERFRTTAIEKGFTEAWIVPERVFKNPPPPPLRPPPQEPQ